MDESTGRVDLLASLHPVTRALRRIEEASAAREGLSMWQYAILSVVAEQIGASQREIAGHLQYSPNRLVIDLHDLEHRGFVVRRPGPDRRANLIELTRPGDTLRRRIQAEIHRGEDELLDGLTGEERVCFDRAARHLARRARAEATTAAPSERPTP